MNFEINQNVIDNITGTILGGISLAFLLFILKEYFFTVPNINGNWTFITNIESSQKKSFEGLQIKFHILICQLGNEIIGSGEKISEENPSTKHSLNYTGENRVRITVKGFLNKKYFSKSELTLHIIEHGSIRESSSVHVLKYSAYNKNLVGSFFTTAADSKGNTRMIQ